MGASSAPARASTLTSMIRAARTAVSFFMILSSFIVAFE
jgi:hypothetical protein